MDLQEITNDFNSSYPSSADLRDRAKSKVPKFAYEYLTGGCNEDYNLALNKSDIRAVELMPNYLDEHPEPQLKTSLFGKEYDAPFGISPIGLQGLIWPGATEILASAAARHNVPFILSTVGTASIEKVAELNSDAWFQLYHPSDEKVTDDILARLKASGYKTLVLIADVPTFGFRPRDIRNGLSMPPSMSFSNFAQIAAKPRWAWNTLVQGQPQFATLKPYMPKNLNLKQLGKFMNQTFEGKLTTEKIGRLREKWDGNLVVKGIVNPKDAQNCVNMGVDGIVVSNHGGRQLDAGQSTIKPLVPLVEEFSEKLTITIDSGIRSGPDVARCIASGAKFTFMGRPFMYGVGALGKKGGNHAIAMMKMQLNQIMVQLGVSRVEELSKCLIKGER